MGLFGGEGGLHPSGSASRGGAIGHTPTETWKAGGRHPTRMLSCYVKKYCTFGDSERFS